MSMLACHPTDNQIGVALLKVSENFHLVAWTSNNDVTNLYGTTLCLHICELVMYIPNYRYVFNLPEGFCRYSVLLYMLYGDQG